MKNELLTRITEILKEAGFIVSRRCSARSFDLAARSGDLILLVKALYNIDGLDEEIARSLKRAAFSLLASPIVVGVRRGSSFMEDDVIYHRYGIPAINTNTLYNYFITGMHPYVYSATGGLYVNLNGELIRIAREKKSLSLGDIASSLGVSRRSVSKYEEGRVSTTIEIALKLEEILGTSLIEPLEFITQAEELEESLSPEMTEPGIEDATSSLERYILGKMEEIGFEIFTTAHAPFNAVSLLQTSSREGSKSVRILTGISKYTRQLIKRARILSSLSTVTKTHSVFVVNGNVKQVQVDHTVLMEKEELKRIRDPEEFTCVIEEKMKG